jgi:hypothetical protein
VQKIRRQSPVKGGRKRFSASFIRELETAIKAEQRRFRVSRAFVITVAVAHALGVSEQEDYVQEPKKRHLKLVASR